MNFNNFTIKSQEAVAKATEIATVKQNQAIETSHLLKGMLMVDENVIPYLLKKLNVNLDLFTPALDRIIEVSLGGLTGLFVSFVLVPSSAFQHIRDIAAQTLKAMAEAVPQLVAGFEHGLSDADAHRIQDGIGQQLGQLSSVIAEAEHERPLRFSSDPLTGPLFRTVLRLRHDLVIMGRAAQSPLPGSLRAPLHPLLVTLGNETKGHLEACAASLVSKLGAPSRDAYDEAITRYTAEIEALRQAGQLLELPAEDLERMFAASFGLEQMHRNLLDLDRCIDEWAARRG